MSRSAATGASQVFFNTEDYTYYMAELAARCRAEAVDVLAYCLMPTTCI
jgi:hypothetical protein